MLYRPFAEGGPGCAWRTPPASTAPCQANQNGEQKEETARGDRSWLVDLTAAGPST